MEKNANPHRDAGGSVLCFVIPAETGDIKSVGGVKDVCEKRETLTTRASAICANATPCSETSDAVETVDSHTSLSKSIPATALSETLSADAADRLSNGTGREPPMAAAGNEGGTSKLVNNPTGVQPSAPSNITSVKTDALEGGMQEPTELSKPGNVNLCLDKKKNGSEHGSEPSIAAESRSFDSLESFSNLNSCPSSDLNSEGLEDKGLALAIQSEYGAEGKLPCPKDRATGQSLYHIKWIKWKEENTPIITQNENGPCPLLAIMNVLLLSWKVKLPPMMEIITAEQLMEYLGDYILEAKPKEISEAQRLNYEQLTVQLKHCVASQENEQRGVRLNTIIEMKRNMSDAMAVLHKLQTGLDVNVKFTGVRVFEYTPECIVFDLLDIPLYHGWLVDPQTADIVKAVGNCSYNQLVEKIISCKQSDRSELSGEGFVAEQFLNSTATQLTYHGLCELTSTLQEGELCVFFRNNHFSTMTKFKAQLYLLVTDQGFLTEEKVVWESLHNVDGDGNFCDSEFYLRPPSDPETVYHGQQDQIDQDYLMALSLQQEQQASDLGWEQIPEGISDLELAKKLQEVEDCRASQYYQEQEQAQEAAAQAQGQQAAVGADQVDRAAEAAAVAGASAGSTSPGKQPSTGERKPKKEVKDKDKCVLL
ncbi:Ubiquitin carboxyl-terminal hydrolase MINDY-2 [Triplophysa tibetana]|uniref:Ubiquitin carboxyl-terminal hydrolase n=1 Tax=Triplophysa tibetana TaxID=1572043 RepID=A0A5A9PRB5_9TELE|nr:Ubiquitin carboxyl-terminal hydrolase MINDY-2 [Triplophysa tibetana]